MLAEAACSAARVRAGVRARARARARVRVQARDLVRVRVLVWVRVRVRVRVRVVGCERLAEGRLLRGWQRHCNLPEQARELGVHRAQLLPAQRQVLLAHLLRVGGWVRGWGRGWVGGGVLLGHCRRWGQAGCRGEGRGGACCKGWGWEEVLLGHLVGESAAAQLGGGGGHRVEPLHQEAVRVLGRAEEELLRRRAQQRTWLGLGLGLGFRLGQG